MVPALVAVVWLLSGCCLTGADPPERIRAPDSETYRETLRDVAEESSADPGEFKAGYLALCQSVVAEHDLWNASEAEVEEHLRDILDGQTGDVIVDAQYKPIRIPGYKLHFEKTSVEQFTELELEAYDETYYAPEKPEAVDSRPSCPSIPLPDES